MERRKPKIICKSKFKTDDKEQIKAEVNERMAKLICRAENLSFRKF